MGIPHAAYTSCFEKTEDRIWKTVLFRHIVVFHGIGVIVHNVVASCCIEVKNSFFAAFKAAAELLLKPVQQAEWIVRSTMKEMVKTFFEKAAFFAEAFEITADNIDVIAGRLLWSSKKESTGNADGIQYKKCACHIQVRSIIIIQPQQNKEQVKYNYSSSGSDQNCRWKFSDKAEPDVFNFIHKIISSLKKIPEHRCAGLLRHTKQIA